MAASCKIALGDFVLRPSLDSTFQALYSRAKSLPTIMYSVPPWTPPFWVRVERHSNKTPAYWARVVYLKPGGVLLSHGGERGPLVLNGLTQPQRTRGGVDHRADLPLRGLPIRKKSPAPFRVRGFRFKAWRCPTLTWGDPTLPSALSGFTSEFEMGSGGTHLLLPPGKLV